MGHVRPCIHRLFPCGMWASLVTRHTDNEPLFCLVAVSTYVEPTKQGNKGTRRKGTSDGYNALETITNTNSHCMSAFKLEKAKQRELFIHCIWSEGKVKA